MELEDLKSIWKSSEPVFRPKDEREIAAMLKGRSLSIIDKLKRNIWLELILTLVVSIGLLVYAFTLPQGALKWMLVSVLVVCLTYTFYYVKKLILLDRFSLANDNIRANLETLINRLTSYVNFFKRSYSVLYPVYFCLGLLFTGMERGADEFLQSLAKPRTIISLTILAGLYFFLSTWFTSWYLKKLFGNHLDKLKALLNDIHGETSY